MSEEYAVIGLVIFVIAVFLISFLISVIEGEVNERRTKVR